MTDKIIEIDNLTISYGQFPVLLNFSLSIPKNKLVGILGPNGAGKSSLIKTIIGDLSILQGKIKIEDFIISDNIRRRISYIPQYKTIDRTFPINVFDFIAYGAYAKNSMFFSLPKNEIIKIESTIDLMKLNAQAFSNIDQISGGQFQKALVARAIVQDSDIMILDEPFVGIDHVSEDTIISVLKNMVNNGKSVIVISHNLYKADIFDWIALINRKLIKSGDTKDIFDATNLSKTYGSDVSFFEDVVYAMKKRMNGTER